MVFSRNWVEDVAVEVGEVHHGGVSAFLTSPPLRAKAVVKALAIAAGLAAVVVGMGIHPQEPHQGIQLTHLVLGDSVQQVRRCPNPMRS